VKVGQTIDLVHASTTELADDLRKVASRHATDHAVYHVGNLLAARCDGLADELKPFAERYQQDVDDRHGDGLQELGERVRRRSAELLGRSEKTGMLLLRDLRELATDAHGTEMDWTVLRQGALVARDQSLLQLATTGHQEIKRVAAWLTTRIKESAPQILAG
jgi:hypothetical protein